MRRRREGVVRPALVGLIAGIGLALTLIGITVSWLHQVRAGLRVYRELYRR